MTTSFSFKTRLRVGCDAETSLPGLAVLKNLLVSATGATSLLCVRSSRACFARSCSNVNVRFPLPDEVTEDERFSLAAATEWLGKTLSDLTLRAVAPGAVGQYE